MAPDIRGQHPRSEAAALDGGGASRTTKQLGQPVYSGSSYRPQAFPPSVEVATLFERVGKGGTKYIAGRLGRARISLLPGEPTPDGTPTWRLLLQQALETSSSTAAAPPRKPHRVPGHAAEEMVPRRINPMPVRRCPMMMSPTCGRNDERRPATARRL
jgi:hypothetical protein